MTLKSAEAKTLEWLAKWGGATVKRVVTTCGPRVNWEGLIDQKLLRVYRNPVIGDVLGLTDAGRALVEGAVYLNSPSTVTDGAFALEAVMQLEGQGYRLAGTEYKFREDAARNRIQTDVAVRYHLQVPDDELEALRDRSRGWRSFDLATWKRAPALGYPVLYASVSGGGLTEKRVRQLLREHAGDISGWCHPLLVAVTAETPGLRRLLRRLEWQQEEARAGLGELGRQLLTYDKVRLVVVNP